MNKTLYQVWCEYDIGLEDAVFSTVEKAEAAARKAYESSGLDEEETYDEFCESGLIGYEELVLDPEY